MLGDEPKPAGDFPQEEEPWPSGSVCSSIALVTPKVAGLSPGQGTHRSQPTNAYLDGTTNQRFSQTPSLKINK